MGAWRDNDVLKVGETSGVTPGHWEASSLGTQVRTAPLPQDTYGNTGPGPWPEEHWAMAAGTSPLPHSLVITHPPLYSNCSCLISLWVLSLSLSVFVFFFFLNSLSGTLSIYEVIDLILFPPCVHYILICLIFPNHSLPLGFLWFVTKYYGSPFYGLVN